jgi:hypothetical protein
MQLCDVDQNGNHASMYLAKFGDIQNMKVKIFFKSNFVVLLKWQIIHKYVLPNLAIFKI